MRLLFLHRNFPGQFLHLLPYFAKDKSNQVVFITERKDRSLPGVTKIPYTLAKRDQSHTHRYLRSYEETILHGQAAAKVAIDLKKQGFVPDIIFGHTWGQTLFMKDVFPDTPLVGYFEWFYHSHGSDVDFDKSRTITIDMEAANRVKNSPILLDLTACDHGICPTQWQLSQFPKEFRSKIHLLHDGVNTDYFKPKPVLPLVIPEINLDLSGVDEIITYVSRGLEPYRGFPQFMKAAAQILEQRPNCHIVIVGENKVFYGSPPPGGKTYKEIELAKFPGDASRLHFTGYIPYDFYLKIIQASSVHVYLTYPFVLSWSLMESMSTGCLLVASDTEPVREVIMDGHNGLLAPFFEPEAIAERICYALDHQAELEPIRKQARETIVNRYALKDLLPRQVALLKDWAAGKQFNKKK